MQSNFVHFWNKYKLTLCESETLATYNNHLQKNLVMLEVLYVLQHSIPNNFSFFKFLICKLFLSRS